MSFVVRRGALFLLKSVVDTVKVLFLKYDLCYNAIIENLQKSGKYYEKYQ